MPLYELGYRPAKESVEPDSPRWLAIASTGIRIVGRGRWLRRILFFAWLPILGVALLFFLWEQYLLNPDVGNIPRGLQRAVIMQGLQLDLNSDFSSLESQFSSRHTVWTWLMNRYFRYPQGVTMAIVVGLVAPPLISQDIRSRAQFLYFSRPLSFLEYLIGKAAIIWFYLLLISAVPALVLYVLAILYSPSLDVIAATWDLPIRIVAASIVLILPTSIVALWLSSLTEESRYAAFAWFAILIIGWAGRTIMSVTEATLTGSFESQRSSHWNLLSLYHTLGDVQQWVFGFQSFADVILPVLLLTFLTIFPGIMLVRRVARPLA